MQGGCSAHVAGNNTPLVLTAFMTASTTTVGGGHLVLAAVGQWAAGTPHIILAALRREALPQAAGSVSHASRKDDED